jgi:nucleotide-binding universal stress UspA family protein
MIENILVAMDDSPHSWAARRYASALAHGYGAVVKALSIGDARVAVPLGWWDYKALAHVPPAGLREPSEGVATLERSVEQACLDLLAQAREQFEEEGVTYRTLYRHGVPADLIVEEARTADLVMLGHRGEGTMFMGVTMGSTACSVARRVNKPVLIAPRAYVPLNRILLAYDGSRHADRAMQWAADLALTFQLPLVLLTVHKYPIVAESRIAKAAEYLRTFRVPFETMLRRGDVSHEILGTATEKDCQLIIMGAYGHNPLREMLLGSTTEEVMNLTPVPLLLVK